MKLHVKILLFSLVAIPLSAYSYHLMRSPELQHQVDQYAAENNCKLVGGFSFDPLYKCGHWFYKKSDIVKMIAIENLTKEE
jgi:hypothetical protein